MYAFKRYYERKFNFGAILLQFERTERLLLCEHKIQMRDQKELC